MTQTQTKALALIEEGDQRIVELGKVAEEYSLEKGVNPFAVGIKRANAIAKLRVMLPEVMGGIMSLQGSALGFRTDKDKEGGYPVQVVADAVIEATLRGLPLENNNFNIIAGRLYVTQEGYGYLLKHLPEFSYMLNPGIPKMTSAGAEETVHAEWTYKGEKHVQDLAFWVKVNANMGSDAVVGKAIRKARKWLYTWVTGIEMGDGDVDDTPAQKTRFAPIDVTPKEETPVIEAQPTLAEGTPANFVEAGLSIEQVQELYAANKWPFDINKASILPGKALKLKWEEYLASKGGQA